MAIRKKNPRGLGTRERSELFVARRAKQQTFSFLEVDHATLLAALNTAITGGATLSFAPAQGGIGCTLRVYMEDTGDTEFAGSPQELTELLQMFVEGLSNQPDEVVKQTRAALLSRYPTS